MEKLLNILNQIHPLSDGLKLHLSTILRTKTLRRKDYLLRAGHVSSLVCFIESGLLRCFYEKDDIDVSSWFMKEGDVIYSVESFILQKPSYESIQALEDTVVHYITYHDLQAIYRQFSEFNFIGRVLTEKYYTLSEQRLYGMRMQKSHERYNHLLENFPELVQRVPSKYLASYLGITDVTLSNIKSKI